MKSATKHPRTDPRRAQRKIVQKLPEKTSPRRGADEEESEGAANCKSPGVRWHEKCVADYNASEKKTSKVRSPRRYPNEVIRFVEGRPSKASPAHKAGTPKKSTVKKVVNDGRKKTPMYNTQVQFLEHKYIQCNIIRTKEDAEMALPEEIKPLLINVTFLLHELKQRTNSKSGDDLCNAISKIATLLAELSRRPIKKVDNLSDQPKMFDEVAGKLAETLNEYNGPESEEYDNLVKDIKNLQQELIQRDSDVKYVREQIFEERARMISEPKDLDDSLRNSILKNMSLKAEIKYNKAQFKKYTRILEQKEKLRQRSELETSNLRRKLEKVDRSGDNFSKSSLARLSNTESDVFHGGSLTKYVKSKVKKVKMGKGKAHAVASGRRPSIAT